MSTRDVLIDYTNHRGERSTRRISPSSLTFEGTPWHPDPQWILWAYDVGKTPDNVLDAPLKGFALRNLHGWRPAE